jgi:capsular polysaccharide biosynthesis protein
MGGQALDLKRSAQIVWRLKWLVAALLVLGFLGGAGYTALSPPIYQSWAFVAIAPSADFNSQAALVTSKPVLAAALDGTDSGLPLATLRSRIFVLQAVAGMMSIAAKGNTPAQAIGTANEVARSYIAYAGSGENGAAAPVPVQMFQPATSASGTTLPWRLFYASGTGVLVGALIGVIVALAIGRSTRWLRERDEIADSIGVPVMASVRVGHPAKAAGWTKLLDSYEPEASDAWRLRKVLRELGYSGSAPGDGFAGDGSPGGGSSVAVLSLARDRTALALGPQLVAFAAQQGIPATLVLDARQDAKITAALRAACEAAGSRGPGRPDVAVINPAEGAVPVGGLVVVVAVVDGRAPRVAATMRATTTVLGVTSGAVTAQQLTRVAASAAGDGRDITGILVADPDPGDPTTGRLPQLARLGQQRMPIRTTTAVTETMQ